MSIGTEDPPDLAAVDDLAAARPDTGAGGYDAVLDEAAAPGLPPVPSGEERAGRLPTRVAVSIAFPVLATSIMVGGVFSGVGARFYAGAAGLLGVALAVAVSRVRHPAVTNAVVAAGVFVIGLLMVVPSGLANVVNVGSLASAAANSGSLLRPPVPLTPGWQAIIGWLMAMVGFAGAWVATALDRPSLGLLIPIPVAAVAGISVPKTEQVASGLAVLALFAVGLGALASAQSLGEGDERLPVSYELRKAARSVPIIAAITVALYFLAQAHFLFPKPTIDPTQQPQKPKTVPLSQVQDRVLFEVESQISGPWRLGGLDVYDGKDWRLPPFSENKLKNVPRSGIVDPQLTQGPSARFTVAGLGGAVLPALPNTVGIVASGRFAYDSRNGNIRVAEGQVQAGLQYTVTAAPPPSEDDLRSDHSPVPPDIQTKFTAIPPPPPAVVDLIAKAPKTSAWDEFDFLRNYVLDNVVASGPGAPRSITPDRVQDMLAGTKEASPFEIVAAQAMLARWMGLPSRIGYGFDGGDLVDGKLQVRPRNGATFVEVYFPNFKWLPVIGVPKKAKPTVGGNAGQQQVDPNVLPSADVSVQVFLPEVLPAPSQTGKQLLAILAVLLPLVLLLLLAYFGFPAVAKAWTRSRRRAAARSGGPRARIALAYAEWRDLATDFGYHHPTDTPLMFVERFMTDREHTELAWLVTRAIWGDLREQADDDLARAAEELSRSLRRRLAAAQPATLRVVAVLSRLSLRHPYAPETDLRSRSRALRKEDLRAARALPA